MREVPGTLVFYESPKRTGEMLRDAAMVLGGGRQAVICRELTKKFEEVRRGTLEELAAGIDGALKGEVVVLIDRAGASEVAEGDVEAALSEALENMSVRDAADSVAKAFGVNKRKIYQLALKLSKGS